MSRERFIPFRRASIVQMCTDDLPPDERADFHRFVELLSSLIHHRFRSRLEALKDAYAPFDPDADTRTIADTTAQDRERAAEVLVDGLTSLLEDANFELVGADELDRAFVEESLLKVRLDVDFDDFEAVVFYRRGQQVREADVARWYGLRHDTVSFVNYPKVLVYVQFKDAEHFADDDLDELPFEPGSTIIKLFQNVPRADLEMLFPNVEVRMRAFDKLLIGVPAVISGVIVFATKLVTSLGVLFLLAAFWLGLRDQEPVLDEAALISIGAGMAALGGYLVRQVTKFKNRKIAFMKALSESLYFRNLDNDAGVFHHLLDAAEEEEVKEAVLAYHFLRLSEVPLDPGELDRRIEAWFDGTWDASIDFEVDDGLDKLRELQLVEEGADGRLTVVELAEASRRLDHAWDNLFRYNEQLIEADGTS